MLQSLIKQALWEWWWFPWLIFVLVWFVLGIVLAIWVYKDAKRRGLDATLWLVIVILIGPIGVVIYLVSREHGGLAPPPPPGAVPTCPTCGQPLTYVPQYGRWYCQYCRKYV